MNFLLALSAASKLSEFLSWRPDLLLTFLPAVSAVAMLIAAGLAALTPGRLPRAAKLTCEMLAVAAIAVALAVLASLIAHGAS